MDRIRHFGAGLRPHSMKRDEDYKRPSPSDMIVVTPSTPQRKNSPDLAHSPGATSGALVSMVAAAFKKTSPPSQVMSLSSRSASKLSLNQKMSAAEKPLVSPPSETKKAGKFSSLIDRVGTPSTKLPSVHDNVPLVTSWGMAPPEKLKSNEEIPEKRESIKSTKIKNVLTQMLMEKRQSASKIFK